MKEECAIVFHCNKDYVFALGTMLHNLEEHAVSFSKILVYTDFYDESVFNAFYGFSDKIEFIYYPLEEFISEYGIDITKPKTKQYIGRYTHLCYIKFKIIQLLARFRHVLFMDLDMYVTGNFDELFAMDCDIAWKCGVPLLTKFSKSGLDAGSIPCLKGADRTTPAPNGGFILVNDTMAYDEVYAFSRDFLCSYAEYFNSTIDEIVFAVAALSRNLRLKKLDPRIYNTPAQQFTAQSKIVHFIGKETKPWSNMFFQDIFSGWVRNYRIFSEKTHCVSDKVRDSRQTELSSCRLEFTYDNGQKYGIIYQVGPDKSIQCALTLNEEKYAFDAESLHDLNEYSCHGVQGTGADGDALSPGKLPAEFESLYHRLRKALAGDPRQVINFKAFPAAK